MILSPQSFRRLSIVDTSSTLYSWLEEFLRSVGRTDVRYSPNTIEDLRGLLFGYRDNMRVEIESGVAVTAKTVADLRALPTWQDGLVLVIHVDLDPRLSVVRVERAPDPTKPNHCIRTPRSRSIKRCDSTSLTDLSRNSEGF